MRRVTFGGGDLSNFVWSGPAAHMKIIFPEPGRDVVPEYAPDGPRPTTTRTYTPRRFDAAAQTLDVDFVLHGEGPASTWAAHAQVGQQLVMMGPDPGYKIDPAAAWYVLAGDDAALPAIETLLEAIPDTARVSVFLETVADDEIRTLSGAKHADVRWLTRGVESQLAGSTLLAALSDFDWPTGEGRIYVGCEAAAMRRIRRAVVDASGLDRDRIITRGYWRIGAVNHPDHDYAKD
jgi:NADPH-dependent ferric siderophore reductase